MRLGPPDLEFEAISRDHPDGHAQVSPGAVAASQVPVLLALSRLPQALRPGAPHRASLALRHLLSDQAALRLQGPQHAFAPELGGGDPVRSGRSWPVRRRPSWPTRSCSGSGAASRITVAGMPAPPTAPATSADHRHDPCQAGSQGCPNERADYLFGPGTGGPVGDQHADHNGYFSMGRERG